MNEAVKYEGSGINLNLDLLSKRWYAGGGTGQDSFNKAFD